MKIFVFTVLGLCLNLGSTFAQKMEVSLTSGHTNIIRWLEYSNDGKYIVTAGEDNMAKLWDASTGRELRVFKGHKLFVNFAYALPEKNILVTGSLDGYAIVWNFKTGEIIKRFDPPLDPMEYPVDNDVATGDLSNDGRYLAVGHLGGYVFVYDLETGEKFDKIPTSSYRVNFVRFTPDSKNLLVATGGAVNDKGGSLVRYDFRTGEIIKKYRTPKEEFYSLTLDQQMKYIALSTAGGNIEVLKLDGGVVKQFNWEGNYFTPCEKLYFSPDGTELYAFSTSEDYVNVYSTSNFKKLRSIKFPGKQLENIALSPDGKFFAGSNENHLIYVADPQTGKVIYQPRSLTVPINALDINCKSQLLAIGGGDGKVYLFDFYNLRFLGSYKANNNHILSVSINPEGKFLAFSDSYDTDKSFELNPSSLFVVDMQTGKTVNQFRTRNNAITQLKFTPDGENLVFNNSFNFIGNFLSPVDKYRKIEKGEAKTCLSLSPDGTKILLADNHCSQLIDIANSSTLWRSDDLHIWSNAISPDNKYIVYGGRDKLLKLMKFDGINPGDEIILKGDKPFKITYSVAFTPDSKKLITGSDDQGLRLWDIATGELKWIQAQHNSSITGIRISDDGHFIFSASQDGTVRMTDVADGRELVSFSVFGNDQWAIISPEGYWDGSPQIGENVSIVKGTSFWAIDQFATYLNRPDLLLKKVGNTNSELIAHYEKQYQKRLKKMNITGNGKVEDLHLPFNNLLAHEQIENNLKLKLHFQDSVFDLAAYNIYVNNIPVFGAYGKPLNGRSIEVEENIELQAGENKVEFSCINNQGGESMRNVMVFYNKTTANPDVYLLAFGVSKYQNPEYNLQYAAKDANDLAQTIERLKGKGYANIYTKVLTNEQVTPDAIKASKDFVKNAKPDDTFILFIAGHGMHDSDPEATYYYLTSNADINNLKGTAADFETIEDLLQGIPPRNKLFLMDACESGEIDEEEQGQMIATATGVGISSRGFKTTSSLSTANSQPSTKRTYLYQKDRYIYNDLVRRSGAIVFSSSKGGELSYERSDIENGLFTEYIMKALTTTEADKDGNGIVSTDELREYVSAQVGKASGDLQHPTVDRDNIYQKFGFSVK